jgi:hypothetical protein
MSNQLPFPEGIVAFGQMFPDERACEQYLFSLRHPDGFVCPKCGATKFYEKESLQVVQCPSHHLTRLTAGTIMHRTKQALQTWFWAAYFVSTHTPGMSAVQFQKHLQIPNYETAFQLLHKMRAALVAPDREALSGVIEMDETYIHNNNQDKSIIIGAIEVEERRVTPDSKHKGPRLLEQRPLVAGRLRLKVIPDETAISFLGFASKNVLRGAVIHTDGDPSYNGLASLGYEHKPKVQGKGKTAVYGLDHMHRAFSNLKNWLSGTHHDAVLPKHMQAYCNEFVYRHNRRGNPWSAFNRCLGLAADAETWPEYDTLYHAGEPGGWVHPNPRPDAVVYMQLLAAADDPLAEWMGERKDEIEALIRGVMDHRKGF